MTKLAALLLAFLTSNTAPGRSIYSFEPLPECGTNPKTPTCELRRECDPALGAKVSIDSPLCAPPRWSQARRSWVRVERRATALRRYQEGTQVLARVATRILHCVDSSLGVSEDCVPARWAGRGQSTSLALSGLTAMIFESGGREDVWYSHPPMGLGPAGEVCAMQIMPEYAVDHARWLPDAEWRALKQLSRKDRIAWAHANLTGVQNMENCFEVGLRALAQARAACRGKGVAWDYGMFSMYGTGNSCNAGQFAMDRSKTFQKLWKARDGAQLGDSDATLLAAFSAQ